MFVRACLVSSHLNAARTAGVAESRSLSKAFCNKGAVLSKSWYWATMTDNSFAKSVRPMQLEASSFGVILESQLCLLLRVCSDVCMQELLALLRMIHGLLTWSVFEIQACFVLPMFGG